EEWRPCVRKRTDQDRFCIDSFGNSPGETDMDVGKERGWAKALAAVEWESLELMMLGSSGLGALQRVSLGSHAMRILQTSPVPVVVVPRRAEESYMRGVGAGQPRCERPSSPRLGVDCTPPAWTPGMRHPQDSRAE